MIHLHVHTTASDDRSTPGLLLAQSRAASPRSAYPSNIDALIAQHVRAGIGSCIDAPMRVRRPPTSFAGRGVDLLHVIMAVGLRTLVYAF